MNTLNPSVAKRLILQAQEAKNQGLTKVAANLDHQLANHKIRQNDLDYKYTYAELQKDAQQQIWGAIMRIADYYGTDFDARESQLMAEAAVEELVKELCVRAGIDRLAGAHEDTLPGEVITVEE